MAMDCEGGERMRRRRGLAMCLAIDFEVGGCDVGELIVSNFKELQRELEMRLGCLV